MKKKVKVFIVIGLVLIIGISGKVYIDIQKEKYEIRVEKQKVEAEKKSVIALKNTFEDIRSVEFEKTAYNTMTGYYSMHVKMTNMDGEFVRFNYSFATNHPNEISWTVVDEERVQKEGKTKNKVDVVYSNSSKGEV
jgi:hypothetical protein